jgi:hypothetical protein
MRSTPWRSPKSSAAALGRGVHLRHTPVLVPDAPPSLWHCLTKGVFYDEDLDVADRN